MENDIPGACVETPKRDDVPAVAGECILLEPMDLEQVASRISALDTGGPEPVEMEEAIGGLQHSEASPVVEATASDEVVVEPEEGTGLAITRQMLTHGVIHTDPVVITSGHDEYLERLTPGVLHPDALVEEDSKSLDDDGVAGSIAREILRRGFLRTESCSVKDGKRVYEVVDLYPDGTKRVHGAEPETVREDIA
jgi:hypothetical protein